MSKAELRVGADGMTMNFVDNLVDKEEKVGEGAKVVVGNDWESQVSDARTNRQAGVLQSGAFPRIHQMSWLTFKGAAPVSLRRWMTSAASRSNKTTFPNRDFKSQI
jgi:hypothetical protein